MARAVTAPAVVHLVRHGHVENPRKVVYGRLPGFVLSEDGRRQAEAAARRLAAHRVDRVYTSPLERARQTAEVLAAGTGAPVEVVDALLETDVGEAWLGRPWSEIRTRRIHEWVTYLHRPHEVEFMAETFLAAGERMAAALRAIAGAHRGGRAAVVSHGDPIKAGVLVLTGGHVKDLHRRAVPTGGMVDLEFSGSGVRVLGRWAPARC